MSEILTASTKAGNDACMMSSTISAVERNISGLMRPQNVSSSALSHSTDSGNGGENFSALCLCISHRTFSTSFSTPRAAFQAKKLPPAPMATQRAERKAKTQNPCRKAMRSQSTKAAKIEK